MCRCSKEFSWKTCVKWKHFWVRSFIVSSGNLLPAICRSNVVWITKFSLKAICCLIRAGNTDLISESDSDALRSHLVNDKVYWCLQDFQNGLYIDRVLPALRACRGSIVCVELWLRATQWFSTESNEDWMLFCFENQLESDWWWVIMWLWFQTWAVLSTPEWTHWKNSTVWTESQTASLLPELLDERSILRFGNGCVFNAPCWEFSGAHIQTNQSAKNVRVLLIVD